LVVAAGATASSETNIATIQFKWNNPYKGQQFVNQLMNDYIATQLAWKTESASATESFVSNELQKISASLAAANKDLAAYQAKTGILDVTANGGAVISQLSNYEVQQTTIQLQQEALQQLSNSISQGGGELNPYLISQAGDPTLAGLATTLVTDQATLQADRVQFTSNAPEIQGQEASIDKIEQSIRTIVANDEAYAARSLTNIQSMIAEYQAKIKSMPAESLQVLTLTQSSQVFGQLYVLLMEKEEEAEVSKAATIVETRVISPAELPLMATKPSLPESHWYWRSAQFQAAFKVMTIFAARCRCRSTEWFPAYRERRLRGAFCRIGRKARSLRRSGCCGAIFTNRPPGGNQKSF
jgi:uncharacterized protein involved in exopolysaccharide biosynthesis